jgi:hypothetical protein
LEATVKEHEYALLDGTNRSKVGRYLGSFAALISAGVVYLTLMFVDLAKGLGWSPTVVSSALSLIVAAGVYVLIYALFNRYALNFSALQSLLGVPNLAGDWRCVGKTVPSEGAPGRDWEGVLTIVQSWDKIRVRLKTAQSGSNSVAAALAYDAVDGYRLLYNYDNDPSAEHPELTRHRGWADVVFAKDLKSAKGEYFNGQGRYTFGTMQLTRI